MAETMGCEVLKLFGPVFPTMWRNKTDILQRERKGRREKEIEREMERENAWEREVVLSRFWSLSLVIPTAQLLLCHPYSLFVLPFHDLCNAIASLYSLCQVEFSFCYLQSTINILLTNMLNLYAAEISNILLGDIS